MSEEQLSVLLAKLKNDAGLQEKLNLATDLDAAVVIFREAGFDVSKADWLRYQASHILDCSDEELETFAGGKGCKGLSNWRDQTDAPTGPCCTGTCPASTGPCCRNL